MAATAGPSSDAVKRQMLAIEGMHCAACVGRVEKALSAVPGVSAARVNLTTAEAAVEYDPLRTAPPQFVAAVDRAGYTAVPMNAGPSTEELSRRQAREALLWRRRVVVGVVLLAPLLVLHYGEFGHTAAGRWVTFLAAVVVQVYLGAPYFRGAARGVVRLAADMDLLIALGTGTAFAAGVYDWIVGRHSMYFMDAAMILVFVTLGKYLEARARHRTGDAIRKLVELAPIEATVIVDLRPQKMLVAEVDVGATIVVQPGARVPLDAMVLRGTSAVDQAWLTGESMPVEKQAGDELFAGTINGNGSLTARVTRRAGHTVLSQTIELVRRAQESKPPIQRVADRVVGLFVPAVLVVAAITLSAWGAAGDWATGLSACVAVLVVACPCALGLAVPTAVAVASGRGAESGILFKEAASLEVAARLTYFVFDKTGTLTEGRPRVVQVTTVSPHDEDDVLAVAAAVQRLTSHPLAACIVAAADARGLPIIAADGLQTVAGRGVSAQATDGRRLIVGNEKFMADEGIDVAMLTSVVAAARAEGGTPVFTATDRDGRSELLGVIVTADAPAPTAREAVARLQQLGLKTLLLSGDHRTTAEAVARQVGIAETIAEVLPAEKLATIRRLQEQGHRTAMIGDGINDAPALSAADLGFAVGHGSDVALEAADVVLAARDLRNVAKAVRLARTTLRVIRQNLFFALAYNVVLIPAAAGVWAVWLGTDWRLPPVAAAAAMAASSVSVVTNSLSLRFRAID